MSVCHLTIASSNYIYLFLYVLFSVPINLLHSSIGSFYASICLFLLLVFRAF